MKLRGAWGHEAQALAQLHAAAFDHAWSADEIAQLLDETGTIKPADGYRSIAV